MPVSGATVLELPTESTGQSSPAAEDSGKVEEGFVDVAADLPADAQAVVPVEQGDGAFDDVAVFALTRAVFDAASTGAVLDTFGADEPPVLCRGRLTDSPESQVIHGWGAFVTACGA